MICTHLQRIRVMSLKADAELSAMNEWSHGKEKGNDSTYCHQCHKNYRGMVLKCMKCQTKQYCHHCVSKWYPKMNWADFVEACPCCRNTCNCKACLRKELQMPDLNLSAEDRILYSKHIVKLLLPSLKQFLIEEKFEREEAKLRGFPVPSLRRTTPIIYHNNEVRCNKCKTSIFDVHRSCLKCSYKLCVSCCRDVREEEDGHYLRHIVNLGGILCPLADVGGCGQGKLDLTSIYPENLVSKILTKAEAFSTDMNEMSAGACSCLRSCDGSEVAPSKLCKADSGDESNDNYLYCATPLDVKGSDLKHFQWHLYKGEPVIVNDVVTGTSELNWEPMVMRRACNESSKTSPLYIKDFNVLNCLNGHQESININQFFKGYVDGIFDHQHRLKILKLEDWPPSESLKERLPRHSSEVMLCMPFKEYTTCAGYLNISCKIPETSVRLDTGPKLCVGYGGDQERGSITKLHYTVADRVNILMHTAGISLKPKYPHSLKKLKEAHVGDDAVEIQRRLQGTGDPEGGAVWDIFRRQDVPMLVEYLSNHSREFMNVFSEQQMVHPIHDQAFYLTEEHKRKLKEEYGIEPWTLVQRLGDAVFVPAGCPHQIRNVKSCTSVSTNFVSPESVRECIRLCEEYRHLPNDHRCKEDKLQGVRLLTPKQVKRLVFHAVREAVEYLDKMILHTSGNETQQPLEPMESYSYPHMEAHSRPVHEPMQASTSESFKPTGAPTEPILDPAQQSFIPIDVHANPVAEGPKPSLTFMWQELVKMKMILKKQGKRLLPEVRANLDSEIEGLLRKIGAEKAPSSSSQNS